MQIHRMLYNAIATCMDLPLKITSHLSVRLSNLCRFNPVDDTFSSGCYHAVYTGNHGNSLLAADAGDDDDDDGI